MSDAEYIQDAEVGEAVNHSIVKVEQGLTLQPVMNLAVAKERLREFQTFVKEYLKEGEDFGTIPGTPKPTLYKPGADKLCELYGIADEYSILDKTEDFDKGLFDYNVQCRLVSRRDGTLVSTGLGSCNSYEGRYRWRDAKPICPACNAEAIFKSKDGSSFYCWAKKGGCGQKFPPDSARILEQQTGKVLNDDIATLKNTILKMAKKRAKVDATLAATRSSGIFTQDVEDFASEPTEHVPQPNKPEPVQAPPSPPTHNAPRGGQTVKPAPQVPTPTSADNPKPGPGSIDNGLLYCRMAVVDEAATSKGTKYYKVQYWGTFDLPDGRKSKPCEVSASVWDKKLFEAVVSAHLKTAVFRIERKGKYVNIIDVVSIDGRDYENGVPVIQLRENDRDAISDEDIPF